MEHIEWLDRVAQGDSRRQTALRMDMPVRTFATQVKKEVLPAETVIAVALTYGAHPVRALVDTGYLDEKWAESVDPITALRQVSEDDLADEVLRRMKLPGQHEVFETPVDELQARRSNTAVTPGVPTVVDDDDPLAGINPEEHAAHPKTKPMETDHWT